MGLLAGVCLRVVPSVRLPRGSMVAGGAAILFLSFMVAQVVLIYCYTLCSACLSTGSILDKV